MYRRLKEEELAMVSRSQAKRGALRTEIALGISVNAVRHDLISPDQQRIHAMLRGYILELAHRVYCPRETRQISMRTGI